MKVSRSSYLISSSLDFGKIIRFFIGLINTITSSWQKLLAINNQLHLMNHCKQASLKKYFDSLKRQVLRLSKFLWFPRFINFTMMTLFFILSSRSFFFNFFRNDYYTLNCEKFQNSNIESFKDFWALEKSLKYHL